MQKLLPGAKAVVKTAGVLANNSQGNCNSCNNCGDGNSRS
jgi:hypothetical protein